MPKANISLSETQTAELKQVQQLVGASLHLPNLSMADLVMMAVAKLKQEYEG